MAKNVEFENGSCGNYRIDQMTFTFHGVITILNIKITPEMEVVLPYKTLKWAPELV